VLLSERHHDLVRRELREPVRSGSAPLLEAFPGPLPAVGGWVRTAARPGAEVPARAGDDPLFATARVGAGRSAAFMADLAGPEGSAWRAAGPFWTGLARWLARGRPGPTVREEAGELRLEGAPGEAAEVVATRPEGGEQVRFVRVGRGRWSAERPAGAVERLRFEREPGLVRVRREAEVERILPGPRTGFLEELAARAGGSVLRVPEAPRPGGPPPRAALRGRPVLLGIALLLLLLGAGLGRPAAIKDRPSGVR
jgi:hypothetical protein